MRLPWTKITVEMLGVSILQQTDVRGLPLPAAIAVGILIRLEVQAVGHHLGSAATAERAHVHQDDLILGTNPVDERRFQPPALTSRHIADDVLRIGRRRVPHCAAAKSDPVTANQQRRAQLRANDPRSHGRRRARESHNNWHHR